MAARLGEAHRFAEDREAGKRLTVYGDEDVVFLHSCLSRDVIYEFSERLAAHIGGDHGPLDGLDVQVVGEGIHQGIGLIDASDRKDDGEAKVEETGLLFGAHMRGIDVPLVRVRL